MISSICVTIGFPNGGGTRERWTELDECFRGVPIQLVARALHEMASACLFLCLSIDLGRNVGQYLYVRLQATKMREQHQ